MLNQIKKQIKNNPRTFLTSIAVAVAIASLLPTKTKAAEFKWHSDQLSQETGYVCASSAWNIRDSASIKVGTLNTGECMVIAPNRHQKSRKNQQGYPQIAVIGKSGQIRYLWADEETSNKFINFWHSCSDGTLEKINKMGVK
jgi:predicted membrane-bound dolichyl-phosphate-mannose-protein mannosyltransferase